MAMSNVIPSIKTFAPPEMNQKPIVTLWEEEFNRNGNKQIRVSLAKTDGENYVGISHWYFKINSQTWEPTTRSILIPLVAWRGLENLLPVIDLEIFECFPLGPLEITDAPGTHSYIIYLILHFHLSAFF